jgi:hypothetical protein
VYKIAHREMTAQEKGPLALASGPSLGRKRPRRAAIAQGATAPQQYETAMHKVQGFLIDIPCKIRRRCRFAAALGMIVFSYYFKGLNTSSASKGPASEPL